MKNTTTLFTIATAAFVLWTAGCEKKDTAVQKDLQNAATDVSDAAKNVVDAAKQTGEKVAQDAKTAGQTVAKDATAKAEELAAPINTKAQELIDATKKLINDGRLPDALAKLKELGGEKLSAEQKSIADGLKAQIDKLLGTTSKTATDATKAAGNLIK